MQMILTGWKDSGYIFDGSSMMFKGVQSLLAAGGVRKNKNRLPVRGPQKGDDKPVSDIVLVHKIGRPSQLENCTLH